ncbi:efflux RND transporter periplasmic adaptor subunit [Entomomonas moraniae]|uniref:Efflux RND transporter periplasmic adaptor subunit n=1 Tax=Entomomonas moraniae TaxID=2213226 RepID=A0A3Q9JNY1_9GAMM|nr:efflux RND transporter periplasmic adaptor subunit [Entomomonas moraniae]AZS51465.1 efflux RND transporter periplasmic adaptor subunit [Entomomonas moraniae]
MQFKPTISIWVPVLSLAALILTGCDKGAQQPQNRSPQKVEVVTVKTQPYTLTRELPGRTIAYRVAEVRPQVDGIILKRLFKEGSDVKEGDQLYQIDPAIYQANVKSARANLASAQALEKRYRALVSTKAVSQQQYDDAKAALLAAQANLETAQVRLRYTKVLAPLSGHISRSLVTEGALVTAGQANALTNINQLDPIYVDITQPSKEILTLRDELASGQLEKDGENAAKTSLSLEDGTTYQHEGRLEFSEVYVNESTGAVTLRAIFPNPDNKLLPGMFVRASLKEGIRPKAILIPQVAVTRNIKGEPVVMVVGKDNKVEQRVLDVSRVADYNQWLVNKGLQENDRVIVKGLQKIQQGAVVDPIEQSQTTNVTKTPESGTQTIGNSGK